MTIHIEWSTVLKAIAFLVLIGIAVFIGYAVAWGAILEGFRRR